MGFDIGLFLFTVLCASVGGVQGLCRHIKNDDMVEYSCTGGQLSDLDDLPAHTGKIRITNMLVPRISVDTFSRFGADLWVLGCSHCGIMDIEPGAFQRLTNLQQLSLDNNDLRTVRESWFKGLDYLTYLDLNYNNIRSIEDGVFENLPSLVDLRLSGNRLECLNLQDMSHLTELKRMFLTENSEFKCPNAVSSFLDNRGVSFERDPEWRRLPTDLVPVELPNDYDTDDGEIVSEEPATPLPAYRERLRPTAMTPSSGSTESTPAYTPPRFHTTEEVVYRPGYDTLDWRTVSRLTTPLYEDARVTDATTMSQPYENTMSIYVPPRTIAPIEEPTYPSRETTTPHPSQEATTTLRSWPSFSESTSARSDFPLYPPRVNENEEYSENYPDYPGPTYSSSMASGPDDLRETPSSVKPPEEEGSEVYAVDWPDRITTTGTNSDYPTDADTRPPEYRVPLVNPPESSRVAVRPIPYSPPEMVQPASPDNTYQAPYYEHAVTVHSPPLVVNQPQQEEVTPRIVPIETTTDKPLPNCPTRNSSASSHGSVAMMIVVSVSLVIAASGLAGGF